VYQDIATVRPINLERHGSHNCGENWGFLSEHESFVVTYRCCYCETPITLDQCAAWPITETDCPHCYRELSCELSEQKTGCMLR
jgi:hypothetical protein